MFRFYNANSKQLFVDDCVIRAISLAENMTWKQTYKKLSRLAMEKGMMIDSVEFVESYLNDNYSRECEYGKSVGQFVREHNVGIYLITMPNHITIAIDGKIYDTFDCSDRIMRCAWLVEK